MRTFNGRIAPEHLAKYYINDPEFEEEEEDIIFDIIDSSDDELENIPPAPASSPVSYAVLPLLPLVSESHFTFVRGQDGGSTPNPYVPVANTTPIYNYGRHQQGGPNTFTHPIAMSRSDPAQPHFNFTHAPEPAAQAQQIPAAPAGIRNDGFHSTGDDHYNPMVHSSSEFLGREVWVRDPAFRDGQTAGALRLRGRAGNSGLTRNFGFTRHSIARIHWQQGPWTSQGNRVQLYHGAQMSATMRPANGHPEFRPLVSNPWNGPEFQPATPISWNGPEFRSAMPNSWNGTEFRTAAPNSWNGPEFRPASPIRWNGPEFRPATPIPWNGPEFRTLGPIPWNGPGIHPLAPVPTNDPGVQHVAPTQFNGIENFPVSQPSYTSMNSEALFPVVSLLNPPFVVPPYYQAPNILPHYAHNENNPNEIIQPSSNQQEQTSLGSNNGLDPSYYENYYASDDY